MTSSSPCSVLSHARDVAPAPQVLAVRPLPPPQPSSFVTRLQHACRRHRLVGVRQSFQHVVAVELPWLLVESRKQVGGRQGKAETEINRSRKKPFGYSRHAQLTLMTQRNATTQHIRVDMLTQTRSEMAAFLLRVKRFPNDRGHSASNSSSFLNSADALLLLSLLLLVQEPCFVQ
jgi:hypothetical protein